MGTMGGKKGDVEREKQSVSLSNPPRENRIWKAKIGNEGGCPTRGETRGKKRKKRKKRNLQLNDRGPRKIGSRRAKKKKVASRNPNEQTVDESGV